MTSASGDEHAVSTAPTLVPGAARTAGEHAPAAVEDGPLVPGRTFAARYHVRRRVGIGGMGAVYHAWDTALGVDVAIKLIRPEVCTDPALLAEVEQRFKRELLLGRRVAHANVVRVHDLGEADGLKYITMSYVDGVDLARMLERDGRLEPMRVVAIGRHLAAALVAVHAAGIVHRDLKPANVMIGRDDAVWLTDFGVARLLSDREDAAHANATPARLASHTRVGARIGTPEYMAPEQARGEPSDARADLYSFGLMLHDALSGAPMQGAERRADPTARRRALTPAAGEPASQGLQSLHELIDALLQSDPARRPQTAADVLARLERIATGFGGGAATAPEYPTQSGARSKRSWTLAAAGVLAAIAVATAGYVAWSGRDGRTATPALPSAPRSVAVLPFRNVGDAPEQQYFADGLTEELRSELAAIPDLRVPGRVSSAYFRDRGTPLAEIARTLGVTHVLDGSVHRQGDRLRVRAELVRAADGAVVWARSFDRTTGDAFAVQDGIAAAVVEALETQLVPTRATARRTTVPAAYNEFLLGRSFERRESQESMRLAIAAYRRAIALDPNFAEAHATLALLEHNVAAFSGDQAATRAALERADHAVALAPDLPATYIARSRIRMSYLRDWRGAQADIDRAVALDPRSSAAANHQALLLWGLGRLPEAIQATRRAIDGDPLLAGLWANLGYLLSATGSYGEARAALERSLQISPEGLYPKWYLGRIDLLEGRPEAALATFRGVTDEAFRLHGIALAEHAAGRRGASDAALQELVAKYANDCAYQIAEVHAARGEIDAAFRWLERAYDQHDGALPADVKVSRLLDGVRSDPRYGALLRKIGLPE